MILAVDDIDAAREDLVRRGVEVSGVFHLDGGPVPGPDPEGRSYQTYVSSSDPDGNGWLLQEIKTEAPRPRMGGLRMDVAALSELLHETSVRHGSFEAVAPPHDWWDWYAAYMDARAAGSTTDEASAAAGRYMAEVKHVVIDGSPAT